MKGCRHTKKSRAAISAGITEAHKDGCYIGAWDMARSRRHSRVMKAYWKNVRAGKVPAPKVGRRARQS